MSDQGKDTRWTWRDGPVAPGPTVVVDIDGVLADANGRQHFLEQSPKAWDAFFAAVGEDPLILEFGVLLALLEASLRVALLTGRPERVRPQTSAWLAKNRVRWDLLIMRDEGEFTPSKSFKRRSLRRLRDAGFTPVLAFDDEPSNVAMFREEGVPTVYIHSGYYG